MAKNLEELRKDIKDATTLKVRASERVLALRQQYTQKSNALKSLGVENPKDLENEINKRKNEIEELTKKVENLIPSDIISKYAKKDFSKLSEPDLSNEYIF